MVDAVKVAVEDAYLKNYVSYYAYKISRRFPVSLEKEDVEQELWVAIISALNKSDGSKPDGDVARSAVYSTYGHIIDKRYKRVSFNESIYRYEALRNYQTFESDSASVNNQFEHAYLSTGDRSYTLIEANDTLDNIEKLLKKESGKAKQYTLALKWFKLLRKGYSIGDSAKALHVSANYLYVIKSRVFKGIVRNYNIM